MKNLVIASIIALFLLPSCVVTRSRYGNGIHMDMPEIFGNKKQIETANQSKEKRKKSHSLTVQMDSSIAILSPEQATEPSIPTIETMASKTDGNKLNKPVTTKWLNREKIRKSHDNKSESIASSNELKTTGQTKRSSKAHKSVSGDNDMFELFGAIIGALLLGLLLYVLIIFIIVVLIPPAVLETIVAIAGIVSMLLYLMS